MLRLCIACDGVQNHAHGLNTHLSPWLDDVDDAYVSGRKIGSSSKQAKPIFLSARLLSCIVPPRCRTVRKRSW